MKKHYAWLIWIFLGIAALIGAGYYAANNYIRDEEAGRSAQRILDGMQKVIGSPENRTAGETYDPAMQIGGEKIVIPEMPTADIDGNDCIGILEVPEVNIELPVIAEYTEDNLRLSPCCYTGSYYADDMVIVGHSYYNHLRPIRKASIGADVYFTNVEGKVYHYIISNVEILDPSEVARMVENSKNSDRKNADWDLTIFTCTSDTSARYTVRCIRDTEYGKDK